MCTQSELNTITKLIAKAYIDCHRAIMVTRTFSQEGIEVNHILSNGEVQSQKELDNRLLEKYFHNGIYKKNAEQFFELIKKIILKY